MKQSMFNDQVQLLQEGFAFCHQAPCACYSAVGFHPAAAVGHMGGQEDAPRSSSLPFSPLSEEGIESQRSHCSSAVVAVTDHK